VEEVFKSWAYPRYITALKKSMKKCVCSLDEKLYTKSALLQCIMHTRFWNFINNKSRYFLQMINLAVIKIAKIAFSMFIFFFSFLNSKFHFVIWILKLVFKDLKNNFSYLLLIYLLIIYAYFKNHKVKIDSISLTKIMN